MTLVVPCAAAEAERGYILNAYSLCAMPYIVDRLLKDTWHCVVWYSMV